jgi:hypothetical protein
VETANQMFLASGDKTRRLLEKDGVGNGAIQICTFDVKMMNGSSTHSCHGNNQLNRTPFHDGGECFLVVQTFILAISSSNEASFELRWGTDRA